MCDPTVIFVPLLGVAVSMEIRDTRRDRVATIPNTSLKIASMMAMRSEGEVPEGRRDESSVS